MAVRVADSLKQQNDLKTFPVAYSEDIWLDENKGEGDANFKDLQTLYNENKLGGSGLPEPESADKVLVSASSNTRADGLEWKQVSKNDVGLQLPEFESLEEWDSLPADEKSKYYNAGKGYVVIKEDVKGAKGVIDDTKPNSTVTTLSAKKINDSLEDKADKSYVDDNFATMDSRNIVLGTDVFKGGESKQVKNGKIVSLQLQIWGNNIKTGRTVLATNLYKPINKVKPIYFFDDKVASDDYNLQITTSGELVALNGFSSNTCFINVSYTTSE